MYVLCLTLEAESPRLSVRAQNAPGKAASRRWKKVSGVGNWHYYRGRYMQRYSILTYRFTFDLHSINRSELLLTRSRVANCDMSSHYSLFFNSFLSAVSLPPSLIQITFYLSHRWLESRHRMMSCRVASELLYLASSLHSWPFHLTIPVGQAGQPSHSNLTFRENR